MQQKTVVVKFFKANEEMQRFIAADLRITEEDLKAHWGGGEEMCRFTEGDGEDTEGG